MAKKGNENRKDKVASTKSVAKLIKKLDRLADRVVKLEREMAQDRAAFTEKISALKAPRSKPAATKKPATGAKTPATRAKKTAPARAKPTPKSRAKPRAKIGTRTASKAAKPQPPGATPA